MTKVFWIFLSNEAQIIREQKNKNKNKNCRSKLSSVHTLAKAKILFFTLLSF